MIRYIRKFRSTIGIFFLCLYTFSIRAAVETSWSANPFLPKHLNNSVDKDSFIDLNIPHLPGIVNTTPSLPQPENGGPSSPEVQQFSPAENTELVNPFTGDFNYQIPLIDVGGYPLTLSYSSNISMESEAGMVGLGWSINTGSISRDVRGLPDDLSGDGVQVVKSAKPKETMSFGAGADLEITGYSTGSAAESAGDGSGDGASGSVALNAALELEYGNYDGWAAGYSAGFALKGSNSSGFKSDGALGVGLNSSSDKGARLNTSASIGFEESVDANNKFSGRLGYGLSIDSRRGIVKHVFSPEIGVKNRSAFGTGTLQMNKVGIKNGTFSAGGDFNIGYSSPSMRPSIDWPMYEDGFASSLKLGGEVGGVITISGEVDFSYSKSRYARHYESIPAYGYLYAHNSSDGRDLMDVIREKGGSISKEIPNLPMAQFAHDIYSVNVQGIQSTFRPFRGDAGTLYDASASTASVKGELGADVGVGDLVKVGVDIKIPIKYGNSGKWQEGNAFNEAMAFHENAEGNITYEPVYFKSMGEAVALANEQLFEDCGGFDAVSPSVDEHGNTGNSLITQNGETAGNSGTDFSRQNREFRQNNFQWLTSEEAAEMAVDREIISHKLNTFLNHANQSDYDRNISRSSRIRYGNCTKHISEITVLRTDGTRFVFGIPAYNNQVSDVSFNLSGAEKNESGLAPYVPGIDNGIGNNRGRNNRYEKETTPAHPYAWLLTDMLSADYTDLTGNGPSSDDLGTYTRFNYTRVCENYAWRAPYEKNMAILKEGSKTDEDDNMGSYAFGNREVWYVHSIETKNYIAEFTYENRDDAVGVDSENGGRSENPNQLLKKLVRIDLYAKASRLNESAEPLRSVYFEYDYSLCKNHPSNITDQGKLTLRKLWFQARGSEKGSRTPYEFFYSDVNPNYHRKKSDRWGTYFDSGEEAESVGSFAELSKETADNFASAWLLRRIIQPTGSILSIQYESNDYAFVQNKVAMEMRSISGFADVTSKREIREGDEARDILYNADFSVNNYVQFKLKQPAATDEDIRVYLDGISELYFAMNTRLSNPDAAGYEKIEGFVPVQFMNAGIDFGKCDNPNYGWIRLPQMHDGDEMRDMNTPEDDHQYKGGVHPIAKAAWEVIRDGYMNLVYNEPVNDFAPEAIGVAIENCIASIGELFDQANQYLRDRSHANKVKLKGAKIRLNSPDQIKFGGGARVKRIYISDEWGNMIQDPQLNFSYGKQYRYTRESDTAGSSEIISSGVAQYEPAVGGEENPFVVPYRYTLEQPLSIDQNLYHVGPAGQIYFPAAVIGYSEVQVSDIVPENAPAAGNMHYEFYTAKDFPVIVKATQMNVRTRQIQAPPFYSEEHLNATQGFCIELNDMHGKMKAISYYSPDSSIPVSGSRFIYHTDPENTSCLSNVVRTVDHRTGEVREELVGVDFEFFADAAENQIHLMDPSADVNLDISIRGPIPIIIPTVYPGYTHHFGRLRVATFNKVIYRSGLLSETIVFKDGTQLHTDNVCRDRESGEVVVQSTPNQFGDLQYTTSIPSRWLPEYAGMRGAYLNQALALKNTRVTTGRMNVPDASNYFTQGDYLMCTKREAIETTSDDGTAVGALDNRIEAWVMLVETDNDVYLIDRAGDRIATGDYDIKILRSGFRNLIYAKAGEVKSLRSPVSSSSFTLPASDVIYADATEFRNHWQSFGLFKSEVPDYQCECEENQVLKRNAADLLSEFLQSLFLKGDHKRRGVVITPEYSSGARIFASYVGSSIVYNGLINGSMTNGSVTPYDRALVDRQCEIELRMADGITPFPDSIVAFTMDTGRLERGDGSCMNIYTAKGTITYLGAAVMGQNATSGASRPQITAPIEIRSCIPLVVCNTAPSGVGRLRCISSGTEVVNPFVLGVLGNWRPFKKWRYATTYNHTDNMKTSGVLNGYTSFFSSGFPLSVASRSAASMWKEASTMTIADPYGHALESRDAVGLYSSMLYGYTHSLPIAEAANARYGEIAFDGFEDYNFSNQVINAFGECPMPVHFKPADFDRCDPDVSHTGIYSLEVNSGTSISRTYQQFFDFPDASVARPLYIADQTVLIPSFTAVRNKEFNISVWLRKSIIPLTPSAPSGLQFLLNPLPLNQLNFQGLLPGLGTIATALPESADVIVRSIDAAGSATVIGSFTADRIPVDGWQLVNGNFTIPESARSIQVELKARNGKTWFDDLRISPANSNLKTYVYHPETLQLMATLDENNYATVYVYDREEQLVAIKKETETGIHTIEEHRSGTSKLKRR